jgi:cytoskeletal protein CcmA (bactofilin family)
MRCRALVTTAAVFVCLLAIAHPAGAQDGEPERDRRISVTGGLVVAEGETVDGPAVSANGDARIDGRVDGAVYIGRGDLVVDGRVAGDALVLDGDAFINGRVDGSVTVLNGKATVRPGGNVLGDVASRTTPTAARGTVRGHVEKLDVDSLFAGFVVVMLALLWVAVTLSTALLGLLFVWLFPRAADAVVVAGQRVWASFFLGLFLGIIAPILGLLIMASVVGIPLGFAVLGMLLVLGLLGYVAGALSFGRLMVHGGGTGGRIGAFFAGFGILRFGALVPGLGFIIGFVFVTYGFGALIIAAWRAGRHVVGAGELRPQYAGAPPPEYFDYESLPPGTFSQPPRRRRPPARKSRARKAPAKKARPRKAPAKKRATGARKTGPPKSTAKKRPARAKATPRKSTTKNTAKKRTARAKAAPRKRSSSTTNTARKRSTPAKRTTKKRAPARKRASTGKSRATNKRASKKAPARKARPRKSRARTARA